jgi:hypothetical protein
MLETLFGLAREGHVNAKGMLNPLQLALTAQEFSDVIVLRKPPSRRATFRLQRVGADCQEAGVSRDIPEPLTHNIGAEVAERDAVAPPWLRVARRSHSPSSSPQRSACARSPVR